MPIKLVIWGCSGETEAGIANKLYINIFKEEQDRKKVEICLVVLLFCHPAALYAIVLQPTQAVLRRWCAAATAGQQAHGGPGRGDARHDISSEYKEKNTCSCVSGLVTPCVGTSGDFLAPLGSKTSA